MSYFVVLVIGLFFLWLILRIVIFYMALDNRLFTNRADDMFIYHMVGKQLKAILYKLTDRRVDQKTGEVIHEVGAGNEQQTFTEWLFGSRYVGVLPNQIYEYPVRYDREIRPTDSKHENGGEPDDLYDVDKNYGIVHRTTKTHYHLWKHVYPVVAKGVELNDRTRIDIFGTATIETFNAKTPVITLRGNWFPHVRDAIEGAINDWAKSLDIEGMTEGDKAKEIARNGSDLERKIIATQKTPPGSPGPDTGTIATTGMGVVAFNFKEWRISEDKELEDATRAQKLAKLKGEATIETAKARAESLRLVGKAKAEAAKQYAEAVQGDEVIASVINHENISKAVAGLKDVKGTVVIGGNNNGTMLPLNNQPSK